MSFDEAYVRGIVESVHAKGLFGIMESARDDVDFTFINPNPNIKDYPLSGKYDKAGVLKTVGHFVRALQTPPKYTIGNVIVDTKARKAAFELRSQSTTKDGKEFDQYHCWVAEFDGDAQKPMIKKLHAYADSALAGRVLADNPER